MGCASASFGSLKHAQLYLQALFSSSSFMLHCLGNALATVSFSFPNSATALCRTLRLFLHQWTITRQVVERDLLFIGYLWVSSRIYYSSWTNNWLIVQGIQMIFLGRRMRNRWHQGITPLGKGVSPCENRNLG